MIHTSFLIKYPWFTSDTEEFHTYYLKEKKITENTGYGLQIFRYRDVFIGCQIDISWRGISYAGFYIDFTLFGRTLSFNIHDTRCWNYKTNTWYTKEEYEAKVKEFETSKGSSGW